MPVLLCVANGQELAGLVPGFAPPGCAAVSDPADEAARHWPEHRLWPLPLKHEALCCITGVGPINAALAMGLAFARIEAEGKRVSAVCVAGLAGAFALAERPLRTLCLVREEIWPEYGLHDGQSVTAGAFGLPLWRPEGGEEVRDRMRLPGVEALAACGIRPRNARFLESRSLTVAGVSASFARTADMRARYGADLENMEGFAAAYAAARQGVPCVEVRCVANKVGPRSREEKDIPGALDALSRVLPQLNLS